MKITKSLINPRIWLYEAKYYTYIVFADKAFPVDEPTGKRLFKQYFSHQ